MSETKERIMIGKDRCDYRAMTDAELIEEAKYNPNPELAISLGERLERKNMEARDNYNCPYCDN